MLKGYKEELGAGVFPARRRMPSQVRICGEGGSRLRSRAAVTTCELFEVVGLGAEREGESGREGQDWIRGRRCQCSEAR